jgi:hypothetical protein
MHRFVCEVPGSGHSILRCGERSELCRPKDSRKLTEIQNAHRILPGPHGLLHPNISLHFTNIPATVHVISSRRQRRTSG